VHVQPRVAPYGALALNLLVSQPSLLLDFTDSSFLLLFAIYNQVLL